MVKYDELIRSLKKGKILPAYLFFGDEEYLIREAVDLIVSRTVDPGSRDFNFTTVYGKGTPGAEIVNLCQTLPFMAERRLVIARGIEALNASDLADLAEYLGSPSPSTCLVMIAGVAKYDKKSLVNAVEAAGAVTRFFPLLDREMVPWIERWGRERGCAIHREAAQLVWQTLGNDLQSISNELEKAVISVKERKNITAEDIRAVIGDFREYTPFDLADALGRKNAEKALLILNRLVQEGEQPVGLLGSIAWNFRRLLRAKAWEAAGVGFEEIKRKLNVIFHQAAGFQEQMRTYDLQELERSFEIMLQADRALKSGGMSGKLVLERMILRLCRS